MNAACAATGACLLDVGPATDADAGLHQNCANQLVWVVLWVYTSTTSERARGGPKVCYSVLLSRLSPPPMTSPGAALSTDKLSFARPLRAKPSSAIDSHGKTRPRAACQTALSAFPENVRKPPKRGASTRESGRRQKGDPPSPRLYKEGHYPPSCRDTRFTIPYHTIHTMAD